MAAWHPCGVMGVVVVLDFRKDMMSDGSLHFTDDLSYSVLRRTQLLLLLLDQTVVWLIFLFWLVLSVYGVFL